MSISRARGALVPLVLILLAAGNAGAQDIRARFRGFRYRALP